MLYKVITLHGDLNQRNLYIGYVHLEETGGKWNSEIKHFKSNPIAFTATIPQIVQMPVMDFKKMEAEVCIKLCATITEFITTHELEHKIDFIANLGLSVSSELQIENNAALATQMQLPIIGEFHTMNQLMNGTNKLMQISSIYLSNETNQMEMRNAETVALLGVLRWREANNVLAEQTNATRDHIAGSIWLGVDA